MGLMAELPQTSRGIDTGYGVCAEVHLKADEEPVDDARAVDGVDQSIVGVLQPRVLPSGRASPPPTTYEYKTAVHTMHNTPTRLSRA